jgi:autotransporter-associated beta strand protein
VISIGLQGSGRAELNVAGGLIDNTGRNVTFSGGTNGSFHWTGTGVVNMNAGTLLTNAIVYDPNVASANASSYVNFNGGTLKASSASTAFLPAFTPSGTGINRVTVNGAFGSFAGGAVIDTNGFDSTIGADLLAPTGDGVTSLNLDNVGSGYIGAPAVRILNGDNSPSTATAYASVGTDPSDLATFGKLTGVVITNPGNITGIPTVNLIGGGGTGATISVATTGANTSGGLTKLGAGTLTLTGTSTYTGPTTVSAGTLTVNGALANTSTTISDTGTLKGSGAIAGPVSILSGGTLASGNSIESLTTGALTLAGGSTFAYEIDNDAAAAAAGDLTAVTGNLTLSVLNNANLTLSELGAGSWSLGEKLTLLSYSGTWNGGLFNYGGTLADDSTFNFSGSQWMFNYNDTIAGSNFTGDLTNNLPNPSFVTMTVVPEPSTCLLGSLGLLVLLRRRR